LIVLATGTFALSISLSPFIIVKVQAESEYKYNNNYNNINFNIPTKIKELINQYSEYYSSEYGYYPLDENLAYYIPKDLSPDIVVSTNFHAIQSAIDSANKSDVIQVFPTIQSAIDSANDGDVIKVLPGKYNEQLNITKSLTIIGSGVNSTIIEAPVPIENLKHNLNGLPLNINSDSKAQVIIKGFYYKISGFYK
jgi:hypothetical protein